MGSTLLKDEDTCAINFMMRYSKIAKQICQDLPSENLPVVTSRFPTITSGR